MSFYANMVWALLSLLGVGAEAPLNAACKSVNPKTSAHNRSVFDTNYAIKTASLPWIDVPNAPGLQFKPLRASRETGMFSAVMRLKDNFRQPDLVHLGSSDFLVLDGQLEYEDGYMAGKLGPGTWGYIPANSRVNGTAALEGDVEFLQNFMGPVAFLGEDKHQIVALFTAADVWRAAAERGITLVPSTHKESALLPSRPGGSKNDGEPLAAFLSGEAKIATNSNGLTTDTSRTIRPHYVDTNALPWTPTPGAPDVKVKILRVSEETGTVNLMVSQQAIVPPHQHLGPSDFIVLEGTMGLVGGDKEGYGPGTWIYEDAGARHEGTFQQSKEDLVYLANIYGPVSFDEGPGTQVLLIASFMDYVDIAAGAAQPLVHNIFPEDPSLLIKTSFNAACQWPRCWEGRDCGGRLARHRRGRGPALCGGRCRCRGSEPQCSQSQGCRRISSWWMVRRG